MVIGGPEWLDSLAKVVPILGFVGTGITTVAMYFIGMHSKTRSNVHEVVGLAKTSATLLTTVDAIEEKQTKITAAMEYQEKRMNDAFRELDNQRTRADELSVLVGRLRGRIEARDNERDDRDRERRDR